MQAFMTADGHPLVAGQEAAMYKLQDWLATAKGGDIFRLFGRAGCGKTTCSVNIKNIIHPNTGNPVRVLFVAFTNRAVSVLEGKGCVPVSTIHAVLYDVSEYSEEELAEHKAMKQAYLDAALAGIPPEQRPPLPPSQKRVGFSLRSAEDLAAIMKDYDVVAVDEASMVGVRTGHDLLKLNKPIIGIGDPGQLKPVGDDSFFPRPHPEVLLTEILRTDNDILELAEHVRNGGKFTEFRMDGEGFNIRRKALPEWFDYEQVICGVHHKRRLLNEHIRKLRGFSGAIPNVGEKVLAVANNKNEGIINGQLWAVVSAQRRGDYVALDLQEYAPRKPEDKLDYRFDILVHIACFQKDIKDATEMGIDVRYDSCLMTWGWAITCHKAQGSEWNSVLVFDDSPVFRDQTAEWAYTAVTRAAKKLAVVSRH